MSINMYDYQLEAINNMKNGCILCGGVGSGKSRTSLGYYHHVNGGSFKPYKKRKTEPDLYIITTARKRDTLEWEGELAPFLIPEEKVHIDSWNKIKNYVDVTGAFFIFDEQRVVGKGQWVKSFLKISKNNHWVILSATPGDSWSDYIPVFVANGFYKNKTAFARDHIIYDYRASYPRIASYRNQGRLVKFRNQILVNMDYKHEKNTHHENVYLGHSSMAYKEVFKERWNKEKNQPIQNAAELCYELRKVVNSDPTRLAKLIDIVKEKKKVIVFYSFDYELDILKSIDWGSFGVSVAEWNGHEHQQIPETDSWVYLVNYAAGAEGWNCIETDTIVFYSQTYSFKTLKQAAGRIDRLNSPFKDLYYYHFRSRSGIDIAIGRALDNKKTFNESSFIKGGKNGQ